MAMTRSGIHHRVSGESGPWVLFIHGVTLDMRMWNAQIRHFGHRWRCITVDLRGHGRSAPFLPGYDPAADLLGVLEENGVESAVVVGLSLGGYEALQLAGRHPERCRSLVLVDAWIPGPEIGNWSPPWRAARELGRDPGLGLWLADPLFESAREQPATWEAIGAMVTENDLRIWTEDIPRLPTPSPRELGPTISLPTQVVIGERELPGFRAVANWLVATIPGAAGRPLAVIPGAGHLPPMEAPEAFNRLLADFVGA